MSNNKPETPDNGAKIIPLKKTKCAMCDRQATHEFRPFCSRRCANLDLGNWFSETYVIPGTEPLEPEEGFEDGE